ncbi:MAG: hypothetical protein AMXMBFR81_26630 [Chthonomonas sp.]
MVSLILGVVLSMTGGQSLGKEFNPPGQYLTEDGKRMVGSFDEDAVEMRRAGVSCSIWFFRLSDRIGFTSEPEGIVRFVVVDAGWAPEVMTLDQYKRDSRKLSIVRESKLNLRFVSGRRMMFDVNYRRHGDDAWRTCAAIVDFRSSTASSRSFAFGAVVLAPLDGVESGRYVQSRVVGFQRKFEWYRAWKQTRSISVNAKEWQGWQIPQDANALYAGADRIWAIGKSEHSGHKARLYSFIGSRIASEDLADGQSPRFYRNLLVHPGESANRETWRDLATGREWSPGIQIIAASGMQRVFVVKDVASGEHRLTSSLVR